MTDLLKVIGVTAAALAVVAVVVIGGQDTTYLVPPPEAVSESFTRAMASRRYDRALSHVDASSGITEISVRLSGERLHARAGAVEQVAGEPGAIAGDRATATAIVTTARAGRIRYGFRLARTRRHLWEIVDWHER